MDDAIKNINVYDFDGTLFKGDSSISFCFYLYKKRPLRLRYLFIQILFFIPYKLKIISSLAYKNIFFCFLNGLRDEHVEKLADSFWEKQKQSSFNHKLIDKIRNSENKNYSVCISASPQFLLEKKIKYLGINQLIATQMTNKDGKWHIFENCRGKEKINRLNKECKFNEITNAYSDNKDDLDLIKRAKNGYVVKYKQKKWLLKKIN